MELKVLWTKKFKMQGRRHWDDRGGGGGWGWYGTPLFCAAKRKKGNKGTKEQFSKQKLLKGCHQGRNVTVLAILECPWWPTRRFSAPWPLHFEIYFAGIKTCFL